MSDYENMTPRQRSRALIADLHELHREIMALIRERLANKDITTGELLALLSKESDIRLTEEWTLRLQKAIERNPSLLSNPGAKGGTVFERLRTMSGKTWKSLKGDGRESRNKIKRQPRAVGDGINLPLDEEPN